VGRMPAQSEIRRWRRVRAIVPSTQF